MSSSNSQIGYRATAGSSRWQIRLLTEHIRAGDLTVTSKIYSIFPEEFLHSSLADRARLGRKFDSPLDRLKASLNEVIQER